MADLSDVEQALLIAIAAAVYPEGTDQPSIVGAQVKLYRGWPTQLGLNSDLSAGRQTITVFSDPKLARETTRYPREWKPGPIVAPSLTVSVTGDVVTFGGSGGAGQVAGVLADGAAFALAVAASDTPSTVCAAFAAMIPGAQASGDLLTIVGASSLEARVEGCGTAMMEMRRQEQTITVSVWCNQPTVRDALAAAVDLVLAGVDWLALVDGSAGLLRYRETVETDTSENANLYRRDLLYSVEYPTIRKATAPAMMFGVVAGVAPTLEMSAVAPRLGAIRFDAWYTPSDPIDQQCATALTPTEWSDRWPPNATVTNGTLSWPAADQTVIDAEIEAAASAGIAFWAFDSYAPGDGLGTALSLYLSSVRRNLVGFCMLGQISNWADQTTANGYAATIARDVGLMGQAGYVTVLATARPVYFVLDAPPASIDALPSGAAGAVTYVRALASAASLPDPYIVWLSGAPLAEYDNIAAARQAGADAAGAYCCPGSPSGATLFATLVAGAEEDWRIRAITGFPSVPTAMTGWDLRPLIENPQPFYPAPPGENVNDFYVEGAPGEIATHVADLADFIKANPGSCGAGLGLIYAWNELLEGGWVMPTATANGPDLGRVSAIGAALALRARRDDAAGSFIV